MRMERIKHENVLPDGTFSDKGGAVVTESIVRMSRPNGHCPQQGCSCSEGHWLLIMEPRTEDGIVSGIRVTFDSRMEMEELLDTYQVTAS